MTKEQAIGELKELINLFKDNIDQYRGKAYDEAKARADFIDKFFALLGWDIYNKLGFSERYRDVVREDRVTIKGKVKAPDYCFRIGGTRKFFVEAKKPAIDIKHDIIPAFQLRRYAYTANLPLSILTDFEELSIYDTRIKPNKTDKASTARIFYCEYQQYIDEFDFIYNTFSKNDIQKGSFDRYIEDPRRKKGTSEVDKEFLKLIEIWRENLAKNIALRNEKLNIYELNYVVQAIIDRLIFLRIAEDRQMEDYGRIRKLTEDKKNIYPELVKLFLQADVKYNSGLFDFKKDQLTPHLKIDDKILKDIIAHLYYPDSPYEFSVLDVEILGNIYEQFLGKTIRLTPAHQAKVEDKPEVKKAGGVYYTPKYIVDYIVENTVGEKIKDKTPAEVSKLKILDPACGSGSFLLGAYQLLLDWHLNYYTGGPVRKSDKISNQQQSILNKALKENKIYQTREEEYHLTIEEKHNILLNNIFGVDIDRQAVEVTKLSLLLKLLEGESRESSGLLFKYSDIKLLPDLSDNIKCGNSLIGSDFYEKGQMSLFQDEETIRRINVFDWEKEFPGIFQNEGFDVVIGNPPYIRQEMLGEFKEYFQWNYTVYNGIADIYVYFIERGLKLLKKDGHFGIIVANKWLRASYGLQLRNFLAKKNIKEIIDFGDLPVFQAATTYPCILLVDNNSCKNSFKAVKVDSLKFLNLNDYLVKKSFHVNPKYLNNNSWSLINESKQELLNKINSIGTPLEKYVDGKIFYGIKTGLNKAFVIDNVIKNKLIYEDKKCIKLIKPFAAGRDIKRYCEIETDKFLILIQNAWTKKQCGLEKEKDSWGWLYDNYPSIAAHLAPFCEEAKKRYDKGEFWWELRPCDYYPEFEKTKIIYPNICKRPEFIFDDQFLYTNQKCFIIPLDDKYLLGILNSSITFFLFKNILPKLRGDFYEPGYKYLKDFPVPIIDVDSPNEKDTYDRIVQFVDHMLELQKKYHAAKIETEKTLFKKQIDIVDKQIDQLVYQLYGLTDEEIKIVEEDIGN
jgi:adenine-specific DNA-methyltransferase